MKALILGNGKSGQNVFLMLEKLGITAQFASSEDINSGENLKDEEYTDRLFSSLSFIVTSPGISPSSPILKTAKKHKIKIIGEFEFATTFLKGDIISVTGTNGKTTTVSLINFLLKQNITKCQTKKDYLLLNADDELLMKNIPKTKAQILYFSTKTKVVGCYVKKESIYFNDNLKEEKLVSLKNIKLVGSHNISNILCAVLTVYLETKNKDLLCEICNFQGVEHRIEYVKNINGISFFNDSKATNISSTLVALSSFKCGINLILGGSDKGYDFDELFAKIPKNVKNIAIFGQTKQKIANSAKKFGYKNIHICKTLGESTILCFNLAKCGEIVLLSPACASFDQFKNFEERGAVFKKIVEEINVNENALTSCKKDKQV